MQTQENKGNENAQNPNSKNNHQNNAQAHQPSHQADIPAREFYNPNSLYPTKEGAKPRIKAKQRPVQRKKTTATKPSEEELFARFTDSYKKLFMTPMLQHFEQNPLSKVDNANRQILVNYIKNNSGTIGMLKDAGMSGEKEGEEKRYQLRMTHFFTGGEFDETAGQYTLGVKPYSIVPTDQRMGDVTGKVSNLHKFGDVLYIPTQSGGRFWVSIRSEVIYNM